MRRFGSPQVGISVVGGPTGGAGRPSQACGVSFADERAASSGDGIRDPGRIVAVEWRGLARRGKRDPLVQAGVLEMFVCLHLRWQGNPRTKARSWQEIGTGRRKRGPPPAPLYGDFDVKNKNVVTSTSFLLSLSSDLNFGRDHPFVRPPSEPILPSRPAGSQALRAQGQSRMAVVQVIQRALHLQATP